MSDSDLKYVKTLRQKQMMVDLLEQLTNARIEEWDAVVNKPRSEDGARFAEDDDETKAWKKQNQVGIKVYCHRDFRQYMNDYSDMLGISTSELIRNAVIEYLLFQKARIAR